MTRSTILLCVISAAAAFGHGAAMAQEPATRPSNAGASVSASGDAVDGKKASHITVNGMVRYFTVYRPAQLGASPAPAVICLQALDHETHWIAHADLMAKAGRGFVVVFPHIPAYPQRHDGRDPQWGDFVDALLAHLPADQAARVDGDNIFLTGLSGGALSVHDYACLRHGRIKAYASYEGLEILGTLPSAPVNMMEIHAVNSDACPWNGVCQRGPRKEEKRWFTMEEMIANYCGIDGISPMPTKSTYLNCPNYPLPDVQVKQDDYGPSPAGKRLRFITIGPKVPVKNSHHWSLPGEKPPLTGFDGTRAIWDFFSEFIAPNGSAPASAPGR